MYIHDKNLLDISEDVTSIPFDVSNPFNVSFLLTVSVSTVPIGRGILEPWKERGLGGGQASIKARIWSNGPIIIHWRTLRIFLQLKYYDNMHSARLGDILAIASASHTLFVSFYPTLAPQPCVCNHHWIGRKPLVHFPLHAFTFSIVC